MNAAPTLMNHCMHHQMKLISGILLVREYCASDQWNSGASAVDS